MNKHELITINAMAREDFLNLEFFLNKYYQSLEFSKPDKSHILTIYSNIYGKEPTILYKQDNISRFETAYSLLPTRRNKKAA